MHLGSGAITPECAALGFVAAAAGVGYSGYLATRQRQSDTLLKAGALGGLVFAAQMLNVPVLAHSSAHFVGGVLLAELLGPAVGVLTMSAVLLLQALLGDGSLTSLGVNIVNMALVPAGLSQLARRGKQNRLVGSSFAAALSVALAVVLIAGEVALGRSSEQLGQWSGFMAAMTLNHIPLLGIEVLLTVGLIALWQRAEEKSQPVARLSTVTAIAALLVVALALTVSSSLDDGYESAANTADMAWLLTP